MGKKDPMIAAEESAERARVGLTLKVIDAAFDGVPPPDQDHRTLYQANAWDAYERIDQRRDHKGRWQDLPPSHIHDCPNALPHLDEQGIHYYLPALMSHFVRAPDDRKRLASYTSLESTLQPSLYDDKALNSYQRRRLSRLTPSQREAIVTYLEHVGAPDEVLLPWRRVVATSSSSNWLDSLY